jgi:anti-sigma regulatory factor (Ser/Thr protein kinase)
VGGASRQGSVGRVREPTGAQRTQRFELQGGETAPHAARRAIDSIAGRIAPTVHDDVRLLVSELVANSVLHARVGSDESLTLVLSLSERRLRVEVRDAGHGFDASLPALDAPSKSGNGLRLVEQLADRWGVAREARTCVWFEVDRPGGSPSGDGARNR